MYFQEGWRNPEKGLVCGYCFLSFNHLIEESLDAVNASRKPKSLLAIRRLPYEQLNGTTLHRVCVS